MARRSWLVSNGNVGEDGDEIHHRSTRLQKRRLKLPVPEYMDPDQQDANPSRNTTVCFAVRRSRRWPSTCPLMDKPHPLWLNLPEGWSPQRRFLSTLSPPPKAETMVVDNKELLPHSRNRESLGEHKCSPQPMEVPAPKRRSARCEEESRAPSSTPQGRRRGQG